MKGKKIILLMLLLAGIAALALSLRHRGAAKPAVVGLYAPDFRVRDMSGKTFTSADFKGKAVFVNFWASWCSPCREEMPTVNALFNKMKDSKDFVMITILYNDSPVTALGYMKSKGYDFPVYTDVDGSSASNFGLTGVPETYIIGKSGVLRRKVIGPDDWTSPDELKLISSLLH
jgi:cytochrome c biogenesis protein CcmG/thiol:disulfide interchange protein DsbE